MKALSLQQPWAWLIVNGHKNIENRDWYTTFRGEVLIHTGKQPGKGTFTSYGTIEEPSRWCPRPVSNYVNNLIQECHMNTELDQYHFGGIVGIAEIVDCVTSSNSPWFVGRFGFVIRNARPLPFTPLKGALGFFEVPDEIVRELGLN